ADIYGNWITPEEMHRLAGIVIYYASLLSLYVAVDAHVGARASIVYPLIWYLSISIGVPLIGRMLVQNSSGFAVHASWVLAVALFLTAVKVLPSVMRNRIHLRP